MGTWITRSTTGTAIAGRSHSAARARLKRACSSMALPCTIHADVRRHGMSAGSSDYESDSVPSFKRSALANSFR